MSLVFVNQMTQAPVRHLLLLRLRRLFNGRICVMTGLAVKHEELARLPTVLRLFLVGDSANSAPGERTLTHSLGPVAAHCPRCLYKDRRSKTSKTETKRSRSEENEETEITTFKNERTKERRLRIEIAYLQQLKPVITIKKESQKPIKII